MLLYHATDLKNMGSIDENGLKARGGFVFLAEDADLAAAFLLLRGVKNVIAIAVDLPNEDLEESFDHNEEMFKRITKLDSCRCYTCPHDIGSECIDWPQSKVYQF